MIKISHTKTRKLQNRWKILFGFAWLFVQKIYSSFGKFAAFIARLMQLSKFDPLDAHFRRSSASLLIDTGENLMGSMRSGNPLRGTSKIPWKLRILFY